MPDKDLITLVDEYNSRMGIETTTPQTDDISLPTELPGGYSNPLLRPSLAPEGKELEEYRVRVAAQEAGIDPDLMAGIAFQESGFQPTAKSKTGVRGTLQVTKATANRLGYDRDVPDENIRAGVAEVKRLMELYPNNINKALSGYPAKRDRRAWVPSVQGHALRAAENRANTPKTYEDVIAAGDPDEFKVPEVPIEQPVSPNVETPPTTESIKPSIVDQILSTLMSGGNPAAGLAFTEGSRTPSDALNRNLSLMSGFTKGSGGEFLARGAQAVTQPITDPIVNAIASLFGSKGTAETSRAGMKERLAQAEESAPVQQIIGQALGILTPGGPIAKGAEVVSKGAKLIPKAGKYLTPSLVGATGAAQYQAMQEEATPGSVGTAAGIGAVIPIALKPIEVGVRYMANRLGDVTLGKWGLGKWANEHIGFATSKKDLLNKTKTSLDNVEKTLQTELEMADNKMGQLFVDKSKFAPRLIKEGVEPVGRFHGTSKEIQNLYDNTYSSLNYYGQGFYTTNNYGIAKGYSHKGGGKVPTVYSVKANKVPIYNAEESISKKVLPGLKEAFGDYADDILKPGKPLRTSMDELRRKATDDGLSADSIQEYFDSIQYQLEKQGYRGISYTGGKLTKKLPHDVKVYWHPKDDVTITPAKVIPPVEQNIMHRASQDLLANEGPATSTVEEPISAELLNYLGDKINSNAPFTRVELNIVKRALYNYGNSWSKTGVMKPNDFAKFTAKIAKYTRKFIEDNTSKEIAPLNQLEKEHMLLRDTLAKDINKGVSSWSVFKQIAPYAAMGTGAAVSQKSPTAGAALTGLGLAASSVPGFTGIGAIGKAGGNPELIRILSTLLPQFMKNKGD